VYGRFDAFDAVAFPLQYGSDAGEGDQVEVIRISPGDATALVSAPTEDGAGKVTGARVSHFGAFLDRLWRENDIMWGRLDAAEILIETLTPPGDAAKRTARVERLRTQAFCAILREELRRTELLELFRAGEEAERQGTALPPRMAQLVQAAGSCTEVIAEFRRSYQRPASLPPKTALRNIGRSGHVMGQVFRSIARERGGPKLALPFSVVARMGQLLTGMVEAAVPRSWGHMLLHHWFALVYVFELLALGGGFLFGASAVVHFAIVALLVTTAANVAVWLVARRLGTGQWWRSALWLTALIIVACVVAGIVVLAILEYVHLGRTHDWLPFVPGRAPSPTAP
jgi:hypothetical protein